MTAVTGTTAIVVDFVCLLAALLFVCLRLYVRQRVLGLSIFNFQDVLIIFAWFVFLANVVQDVIVNAYGLWIQEIVLTSAGPPPIENFIKDPDHLRVVLQISWVVAWLYYFVVYPVKAALLAMYLDLFNPKLVKLRRCLYISIFLSAAGFILTVGLNIFWCLPIESNWAPTTKERCLAWSSIVPYFTSVMFHIVTDVIVYILPFFLLPTLARTASLSQLAGVGFMFSLGLISIVCVVVRTAMVGMECTFQFMACWGAAEQASAIIIACCPPLRYLRAPAERIPRHRPRRRYQRDPNDIEIEAADERDKSSKKSQTQSREKPAPREPASCAGDWSAGSIGMSANRNSVVGGLAPRQPHAELDFIMEYDEGTATREDLTEGNHLSKSKESKKAGKNLTITTFGGYDRPPRSPRNRDSYSESDAEGRFHSRTPISPTSPARLSSARSSPRQGSRLGPGSPPADETVENNRFSISSFGQRRIRK